MLLIKEKPYVSKVSVHFRKKKKRLKHFSSVILYSYSLLGIFWFPLFSFSPYFYFSLELIHFILQHLLPSLSTSSPRLSPHVSVNLLSLTEEKKCFHAIGKLQLFILQSSTYSSPSSRLTELPAFCIHLISLFMFSSLFSMQLPLTSIPFHTSITLSRFLRLYFLHYTLTPTPNFPLLPFYHTNIQYDYTHVYKHIQTYKNTQKRTHHPTSVLAKINRIIHTTNYHTTQPLILSPKRAMYPYVRKPSLHFLYSPTRSHRNFLKHFSCMYKSI